MSVVNLAIQALPFSEKQDKIAIIDEAIKVIEQSGLKYVVCPFETVIEGEYNQVMQLVTDLKEKCFEAGADELIINMKLHAKKEEDTFIHDKMEKY